MTIKFSFKLAPKKAISYLKNKGFKLSFDYDEMIGEAHHQSFTVAKVTRLDVLNDIFTSLNQAQQSGIRFDEWLTDLKPTLQKKGWWGEKDIIDPKTGVVKTVYIGARRLRTIFNTNMRVAYNVQRYHSMKKLTQAIYWLYKSLFLPNSRDAHEAMDGTLLHRDNTFWNTNYPPNGWNCKCKVRAYSKTQAEKRGVKVAKTTPKDFADKDWAHNVGAGASVGKLSKLNLGDGLRLLKPNKALDKLTDEQLKTRFYSTLAIKKGEQFIDKVGDPMTIDDGLFKSSTTKKSKLQRDKRKLYIDELAKTISGPDEIYLQAETLKTGKTRLIKKMFRYFEDTKGKQKALVSMFEYQPDKTISVTTYVLDNAAQTEKRRIEKLIYQKPKRKGD